MKILFHKKQKSGYIPTTLFMTDNDFVVADHQILRERIGNRHKILRRRLGMSKSRYNSFLRDLIVVYLDVVFELVLTTGYVYALRRKTRIGCLSKRTNNLRYLGNGMRRNYVAIYYVNDEEKKQAEIPVILRNHLRKFKEMKSKIYW